MDIKAPDVGADSQCRQELSLQVAAPLPALLRKEAPPYVLNISFH